MVKIGLVRHFKVAKGLPKGRLVSAEELTQWFREYDLSEIKGKETDLQGIPWSICYVSDLPRAIATAKQIYQGKMVVTKELREVTHPVFEEIWSGKLPFLVWAILVRISWILNDRSYQETKVDVQNRITRFIDLIEQKEENEVLLVGHAALMMEMRKELIKRGYRGPRIGTPKNGVLYTFVK